jgi:hypothetical protein
MGRQHWNSIRMWNSTYKAANLEWRELGYRPWRHSSGIARNKKVRQKSLDCRPRPSIHITAIKPQDGDIDHYRFRQREVCIIVLKQSIQTLKQVCSARSLKLSKARSPKKKERCKCYSEFCHITCAEVSFADTPPAISRSKIESKSPIGWKYHVKLLTALATVVPINFNCSGMLPSICPFREVMVQQLEIDCNWHLEIRDCPRNAAGYQSWQKLK